MIFPELPLPPPLHLFRLWFARALHLMLNFGQKGQHLHLKFTLLSLNFWTTDANRYLMEWQCDDNARTLALILFHDVFRGRERRKWRDVREPKEHQTSTAQESSCPDISYRCWGFVRPYLGSWPNLSAQIMINKPKDSRLRDTSFLLLLYYHAFSIPCTIFNQSYSIEWFETSHRVSNLHKLDLNKQRYAKFLLR